MQPNYTLFLLSGRSAFPDFVLLPSLKELPTALQIS